MYLNSFNVGRWNNRWTTFCWASAVAVVIGCGSGCASQGSLQPHQAFRQTVTPSQSFLRGGFGGSGTVSNPFDTGTDSDYVGYQGYNNTLPGFGQPPVTNGGLGGGVAGSSTTNGNFGNYAPAASYNYQPAYSGGFTGGSC